MSYLDSKIVEVGEELVILSEDEEGESVEVGKYAAIKKAGVFEDIPVWSVEEVSPGFKTSDPGLKEMVDNYFQEKNESEFLELSQQKEIEALIYYDRDKAERRMRAFLKEIGSITFRVSLIISNPISLRDIHMFRVSLIISNPIRTLENYRKLSVKLFLI